MVIKKFINDLNIQIKLIYALFSHEIVEIRIHFILKMYFKRVCSETYLHPD